MQHQCRNNLGQADACVWCSILLQYKSTTVQLQPDHCGLPHIGREEDVHVYAGRSDETPEVSHSTAAPCVRSSSRGVIHTSRPHP